MLNPWEYPSEDTQNLGQRQDLRGFADEQFREFISGDMAVTLGGREALTDLASVTYFFPTLGRYVVLSGAKRVPMQQERVPNVEGELVLHAAFDVKHGAWGGVITDRGNAPMVWAVSRDAVSCVQSLVRRALARRNMIVDVPVLDESLGRSFSLVLGKARFAPGGPIRVQPAQVRSRTTKYGGTCD